MARPKRRGRNLKQVEEIVSIIDDLDPPETIIIDSLTMIIKNNNNPGDSTEEGGLIELTNEYIGWISPAKINIRDGYKVRRILNSVDENGNNDIQVLTILQSQETRNVQRFFMRDETQHYN